MNIAIGSDHAGLDLKESLKAYLEAAHRCSVEDMGCFAEEGSVDYPIYAEKVTEAVLSGRCTYGILICGTGIGMSMAANRVPGIRCALLRDEYTARLTRLHNDANVIALGQNVTGAEPARAIVSAFIETPFSGEERHSRRIGLIEHMNRGNES